jgi:citrate synthase
VGGFGKIAYSWDETSYQEDVMSKDTLTIIDNRTGRSYEVEIREGAVRAVAFREVRVGEGERGLMVYDPGFQTTAACRSGNTYFAGAGGVLL